MTINIGRRFEIKTRFMSLKIHDLIAITLFSINSTRNIKLPRDIPESGAPLP